jgi:hypothetical protein
MARCKNVGGALAGASGGDGGDDKPHRLIAAEKGKKVVTKKRKIADRDTKIARAIAVTTEVGGPRGTLRIRSKLLSA